jgi:hypothetical protein
VVIDGIQNDHLDVSNIAPVYEIIDDLHRFIFPVGKFGQPKTARIDV